MSRPTQLRLGGLDTPKPVKWSELPRLRERKPGERCGLCGYCLLNHPDDTHGKCHFAADGPVEDMFDKAVTVPVGDWCGNYVESGRHEGAQCG